MCYWQEIIKRKNDEEKHKHFTNSIYLYITKKKNDYFSIFYKQQNILCEIFVSTPQWRREVFIFTHLPLILNSTLLFFLDILRTNRTILLDFVNALNGNTLENRLPSELAQNRVSHEICAYSISTRNSECHMKRIELGVLKASRKIHSYE